MFAAEHSHYVAINAAVALQGRLCQHSPALEREGERRRESGKDIERRERERDGEERGGEGLDENKISRAFS